MLFNEKVVARLGREIATTGLLPEEAIDLAMRELRRFAHLLEDLGIGDIETVATAAVRDAANGAQFLAPIAQLGLKPRLISGMEEARLSAQGVMASIAASTPARVSSSAIGATSSASRLITRRNAG